MPTTYASHFSVRPVWFRDDARDVDIREVKVKVTDKTFCATGGGYVEQGSLWLPNSQLVPTKADAVNKERARVAHETEYVRGKLQRLEERILALDAWLMDESYK